MRSRLGSSPLTRGKLDGHVAHLDGDRLIPAHAGKTSCACRAAAARAAHPRSRGENMSVKVSSWVWGGSSPLTRGKRASATAARDRAGLIPAHAGKTSQRHCGAGSRWAHPRSRGENLLRSYPARTTAGSSPLTRGKPG